MMARVRDSFQELSERFLIVSMIVGIVLITLTPLEYFEFIQVGLVLLVVSTFLQIAVGNLPRDIEFKAGLVRIAILLCIVLVVFVVGILLVPVLSQLGR
jgi:hypothetical protein